MDEATPSTETTDDPVFVTESAQENHDGDILEELPVIAPRDESNSCQQGLFSRGHVTSTMPEQSSHHPHTLIMGAVPSPPPSPSFLQDKVQPTSRAGRGFKPLIEVVSSSDQADDEECTMSDVNPPFTKTTPTTTSNLSMMPLTSETESRPTAPLHKDDHPLTRSSQDHDALPEAGQVETPESGGLWAVAAQVTKPHSLQASTTTSSSAGLMIEEIDDEDEDFNIGQLPLTALERAAIGQTDAALERIKNKLASELTQEERVWQLAASAGSTLVGREEAELDEETKSRVRERLSNSGLTDKTTLKF